MTNTPLCISQSDIPFDAALASPEDCTIALISGTEGPSYRPVGAAMVVRDGAVVSGSLSSGCIEADVVRHASQALIDCRGQKIRYGSGSPFMDIHLPCGGGLDVTLIPAPDRKVLTEIRKRLDARQSVDLLVHAREGRLLLANRSAGTGDDLLPLRVLPDVNFYVFGKGPEAVTFSALARAAGYSVLFHSFDEETLQRFDGPSVRLFSRQAPAEFAPDRRSAVLLFFHDHDWEPAILKAAAASEAFYIGAQGSWKTRAARDDALRKNGVGETQIARMHGPVGLVRSARDSRTLAVSVLAEVLEMAGKDAQALAGEMPFAP